MNWVILAVAIVALGVLFVSAGEILNRIEDLKHFNRQLLDRFRQLEEGVKELARRRREDGY